MDDTTILESDEHEGDSFARGAEVPAVLVAFAPAGMVTVDHCIVSASLTVGRSSDCDLPIRDGKVSKRHFRITHIDKDFWIEDLGSTNGTFLNGQRIESKQSLASSAVIRAGQVVLVFHTNAKSLLEPPSAKSFGMAGRFHTSPLMQKLRETMLSARHVLLAGPSGTGKELAAEALASMISGSNATSPFLTHNAAQFASEEEAATTLFGVGPKVFTNVDARAGLIEQAGGGIFFLDEAHNLPKRIQQSLLRVIENGQTKRIGETNNRPAMVRFILASNVDNSTRGLAHDLFARLRLVSVPPLVDRVADVPSIFDTVLKASLERHNIDRDSVIPLLTGNHYETLCLSGFKTNNVRGLVDLADRVSTRIAAGIDPGQAVTTIFSEQFGKGIDSERPDEGNREQVGKAPSHYEQNKSSIVAVFHEYNGNISAVERELRSRGIQCSRRWLTVFAERWGLRR
ncbi:MAG: FHA domain-containing protein [Proteobacteria bacterium]|nr:FHA domain-containing protein [Pseudomonadota bacterium]